MFRCDIAAKGVARALLDSHKVNKTKGGGGMVGEEGADQQVMSHKTLSPQTSKGDYLTCSRIHYKPICSDTDRSMSPDPIGESSVGGGAVLVKVPLQADERLRSMSNNSDLSGDGRERESRCHLSL